MVICLQYRRPTFDPWVRKIPWRREWQPIPVFLPGKSHGQRSLSGYSPWACKESDMAEPSMCTHTHTCACTHTHAHPRSWFQHAGFPGQVSDSCLLHWSRALDTGLPGSPQSGLFMPSCLGVTLPLGHEFSPLLVQGWGGTVAFGEWEWGQGTLSHLQMCVLILGS